MDWDLRFMEYAECVSTVSTNQGTRVGAIIYNPATKAVIGSGCNTLVRGLDDQAEEYNRSGLVKQKVWEHAERNAIYTAACSGKVALKRMGMAVNWYPCADCARAIIQTGLIELVAISPNWHDLKWGQDWVIARTMLQAAGIRVRFPEWKREEMEKPPKIPAMGHPLGREHPLLITIKEPPDVA